VDPATNGTAPDGVASLFEAIARLPGSGTRAIYLRGGVHRVRSSLILDRTAEGLTIAACPGEAPLIEGDGATPIVIVRNTRDVSLLHLTLLGPSPVLLRLESTRDSVVEGNTFIHPGTAILLIGGGSNAIRHNQIVDASDAGIELRDGSNRNMIIANTIDGVAATETHGGGIFLHGASGNQIFRNLVQNTGGFGIGVSNWDDRTVNVGNMIVCNLIRNTVLDSQDSGAIYVLGRSDADTKVLIDGNVIDGFGGAGDHTVGIYLDDSTNGALVRRNVVRGPGVYALQIHGGSHNRIENNLIDLGQGRSVAILFQAAPADTKPSNLQVENVVVRNIVLSTGKEPWSYDWIDGGKPRITANLYAAVPGATWRTVGQAQDAEPVFADDGVARDAERDHYAAIQSMATTIGFTPIDLTRSASYCQPADAPAQ
jgi:hypothetical protein